MTSRRRASWRRQIADHGDVPIAGLSIEEATPSIIAACTASVERHALTLLVGGNNAVTRPGVHAVGEGWGWRSR